jgi:hypothetical protein
VMHPLSITRDPEDNTLTGMSTIPELPG